MIINVLNMYIFHIIHALNGRTPLCLRSYSKAAALYPLYLK